MRKLWRNALLCAALIAGAIVAYENYLDWLAAGLFVLAVIPSVLFEENRKELKGE